MDLKRLYTDPKFPAAFSGKRRFADAVRERDGTTSYKEVDAALQAVDSYTLHKVSILHFIIVGSNLSRLCLTIAIISIV